MDDFAPFRHFAASLLERQSQLQIVGEASDGAEGVQKAQALQPHLVLLDIGLPKLNGIEAGRQIFQISPHSKILFISQEVSLDVVHGALATGATGYLPKMDAADELLPAIDAVVRGDYYVGNRLVENGFTKTFALAHKEKEIVHHHEVGFYSDDRLFLNDATHFVEVALEAGNAVIVVATEPHRNSLFASLLAHGWDIASISEQGRYISLDATNTVSAIASDGVFDPSGYLELFARQIVTAAVAAKSSPPRVAIFGECVDLLCAQGNVDAAMQIEKLVNQLAKTYDIDILCAYSMSTVPGGVNSHIFQKICSEHSAVISQ